MPLLINDTLGYTTLREHQMSEATPTGDNINNTNTSMNGEDGELGGYFHFILMKLTVPLLFGLVTLVGAIGNFLVIYVIFSKRKMRTVTNLLLLNLAIADLSFVLIVPPFTAYQFATMQWWFGDISCRLMHYLINVTAYVTVYTLVLISAIRYMTILYSTQTMAFRTKKNIVLMNIGIWAMMLLMNIPIILSYKVTLTEGGVPDCDINGPEVGQKLYATFFVFAYLLPLMAIAILSMAILRYINKQKPAMLDKKTKSDDRKKQASRLIILVVVMFAILWLPVHIHLLIAYFGVIPQTKFYIAVSIFWNVLAYFNSCVNPIIYNYASKDFRDSFREVVSCYGHRKQKRETTVVTRATCLEANGGEMKRLVSAVRSEDQNDSADL